MEIAALNERLRDVFTPVLKHLAHLERLRYLPVPPAPSTVPVARAGTANPSKDQPLPPAPAAPPAPQSSSAPANTTAPTAMAPTVTRGDALKYRAHCLTVLKRLNTYQYGTRAAFVRDLQQLEQLAAADDVVRLLQSVITSVKDRERPEASSAPPAKKPKTMAPTVTIHGLRFSYSGVPSIQQMSSASIPPTNTQGSTERPWWRCNVNVQDVVLTMGERESPTAALALYEAQRKELGLSPHGLASLMKLSDQRRADQQRADEQTLWDALSVCIPKLASSTSVRVPDLIAPATSSSASNNSGSGSNRDDRATMVSSPTSSVSSSISTATPSVSRASSWRNPKRKKPAHRLAFLRLRRLIQKKLCNHLRGQPVCVFSRPDNVDKTNMSAWVPTGRLEAGRVFVLKTHKQVSFADYVSGELGHPASACAHMFLVRTQESIDDHLKVCDAFSEEDREQLGHDLYGSVRNYMQAKDERR